MPATADHSNGASVKTLATQLVRMAILVLLAALGSAILVHFSPGALVDERELDQRMSAETLAAMRSQRIIDNSLRSGLFRYLGSAIRGDLGKSQSYNVPISELLRNNAPATLRRIGIGLAEDSYAGSCLAIALARWRRACLLDAGTAMFIGVLLTLPAGALAH